MMDAKTFTRLWNQSRTVREAGEAIGVSASRAHTRAKQLGLPKKQNPKGPQANPEDVARVRELRAQKLTYRRIRAITGKGMRFVYRHGRTV